LVEESESESWWADDDDARRIAVGVEEMEVGVMEWTVRGVSEEVPKAAKGVDAEVERRADQARVSKSIMAFGREVEMVGVERSRRPALPLLEMDKRLSPETVSASIKSPL
jgi:hypothetical protein